MSGIGNRAALVGEGRDVPAAPATPAAQAPGGGRFVDGGGALGSVAARLLFDRGLWAAAGEPSRFRAGVLSADAGDGAAALRSGVADAASGGDSKPSSDFRFFAFAHMRFIPLAALSLTRSAALAQRSNLDFHPMKWT